MAATDNGKRSRPMEWTEIHDILLCRETIVDEPYKFRKGSTERDKIWTKIANTLNKNKEVKFRVGQISVRERMDRLQTKYMEGMKEESASGIAVDDVTELDALIFDIIDREKDAEEARESEGTLKKVKEDKQTAEEMRKAAMERFGETRKISEAEDDVGKKGKRRRSASDAVEFLKETTEKENEIRAKEIALRKKQQEQESARQAQMLKQQTSMFEAMQNMQTAMMQQQQQRTAAMMALMERLLPKKT